MIFVIWGAADGGRHVTEISFSSQQACLAARAAVLADFAKLDNPPYSGYGRVGYSMTCVPR